MPHKPSHTTKPKTTKSGPAPAQTRKLPAGLIAYMKNQPKKKKAWPGAQGRKK